MTTIPGCPRRSAHPARPRASRSAWRSPVGYSRAVRAAERNPSEPPRTALGGAACRALPGVIPGPANPYLHLWQVPAKFTSVMREPTMTLRRTKTPPLPDRPGFDHDPARIRRRRLVARELAAATAPGPVLADAARRDRRPAARGCLGERRSGDRRPLLSIRAPRRVAELARRGDQARAAQASQLQAPLRVGGLPPARRRRGLPVSSPVRWAWADRSGLRRARPVRQRSGRQRASETSAISAEEMAAILRAHNEKTLLRFVMCGSVDDGKSTLIGRLLYESRSLFADQLARARGGLEGRGHAGRRSRLRAPARRSGGRARAGDHDRRRVPALLDRAAPLHRRRRARPRAVHAQHGHRRLDRRLAQ